MLSNQPTLEDITGILRRRVWWLIVPAILCPIAAYVFSLTLPYKYTSQTLVLVEQQKVPDTFVRSVVTEQLNMRLATMQEQILSRTRLQPIIEKFGLYKNDIGKVPMEDLIDRVRSAINVSPVRADFGAYTGGLPGFYISFTTDNPRLAQQVCSEITSMFMEENLKIREQTAQGTTDFLANQLDEAKRRLDDQEAKLADFQEKYMGKLPDEQQQNMSMLATLNGQLDAVTQAVGRAQQDKTYLQSLLGQQVAQWKASLHTDNGTNPDDLQPQIDALEAQLAQLRVRYTDDYPDVLKTKRQLAILRKEMAAEPAKPTKTASTVNVPEPKEIQQLRLQVQFADATLKEKIAQQDKLQKQIHEYQARLQMTPMVDQEYKKLTRDHDIALKFYNDMLSKKTESEMATDLERRQQGEQFRVMDPPNLPEKPTFPNRPLFAAGGEAIGLGLGIGLVLLLELRDQSIRTERDVERQLQLPVLAILPLLGEHEEEDGEDNGEAEPPGQSRWWHRLRRSPRSEKPVHEDEVVNA